MCCSKNRSTSRRRAPRRSSRRAARRRYVAVVLQHRFSPRPNSWGPSWPTKSGEIAACSTKIPLWRPQTYYDEPGRGAKARDGGGVLITQGIHTLDLMLNLAGPVEEVCGYAMTSAVHRMETEDLACAALRFKNGAIGTVEATTAAYPGSAERIEFIGSKGTAALAGPELMVRRHDGTQEDVASSAPAGGTGADPMAFPHDFHLAVWRDFLDAIDRNKRRACRRAKRLRSTDWSMRCSRPVRRTERSKWRIANREWRIGYFLLAIRSSQLWRRPLCHPHDVVRAHPFCECRLDVGRGERDVASSGIVGSSSGRSKSRRPRNPRAMLSMLASLSGRRRRTSALTRRSSSAVTGTVCIVLISFATMAAALVTFSGSQA